MSEQFDFGDGLGPVAAHRRVYGGGWVADTAYVGSDARVYGEAQVCGTEIIGGERSIDELVGDRS